MRFEVKKGTVKYKGAFYSKGSLFDAEKGEVNGLIVAGVITSFEAEPLDSDGGTGEGEAMNKPSTPKSEMTIEKLKEYLETAEYITDVEELLQAELARNPEPRKTAVRLLEDWLNVYQETDDDDLNPPNFDSADAIVDGEGR